MPGLFPLPIPEGIVNNFCCHNGGPPCLCTRDEKVLRIYSSGYPLPSLTEDQRNWCLSEIEAVEGYERKDYESETDQLLCRAVLFAWADYCRDKGLIS